MTKAAVDVVVADCGGERDEPPGSDFTAEKKWAGKRLPQH